MLKITKNYPVRRLYVYGAATSALGVAMVMTFVVQSHSLHERLMAVNPIKSQQSLDMKDGNIAEAKQTIVNSGSSQAGAASSQQTSSAAPSASATPASASPSPTPSEVPTPTPTPSETPTPEPEPSTEPPVDPPVEPAVE